MRNKSPKNVFLSGYFWNILSSSIAAVSSILVLAVVKKELGIDTSAIYAMAVAVTNVLINIGYLSINSYQIADINERYSFNDYFKLRKISVALMIALSALLVWARSYNADKRFIIFFYTIYKAIFVYYEVYQGRLQQIGRPDRAFCIQFYKILIPELTLCIAIVASKNLLFAILLASLMEILIIIIFDLFNRELMAIRRQTDKGKRINILYSLIKEIFPLFISSIVTAYVLNASKYAIDKYLKNDMQVYYTVLLLPATTIHMLAGFFYRPVITIFATQWINNEISIFKKNVSKILFIILIVAILILFIGKPLLLPILGRIYSIDDITKYWVEFNILLVAGMCNAMNIFLCYIITILNKLSYLYIVYGISFISSLFLPNILVDNLGLIGAVIAYFILVLFQTACLLIIYLKNSRLKNLINNTIKC